MSILLEYLVVFIVVYFINYYINFHNKKKISKKEIAIELFYLKKIYNIDLRKINKDKFIYVQSIINSFIITTIYIIILYLLNNWILRIIIGIILLILMIIICYGILGRYYLKKEGR